MQELLEIALRAARAAGDAILEHYATVCVVERKADGSPLTAADRAAHQVISEHLSGTGYPIVSEEGNELHLEERCYWLVDPLDGTKDFLAANGEFTVNIALIIEQRPVLGVVFAPALNEAYCGIVGTGGWLQRGDERCDFRQTPPAKDLRMAVSRFHDHPDVDIFAEENAIAHRIQAGSALKYGLLATGDVDVFPRLVGSSEWDTAAGQAVLESAGGCVLDWHTRLPLRYGKTNRRNPRLLSLRAPLSPDVFNLKAYDMELL
ncbi:3'(2'),5'-bisphosphate nucleotidase CysQ family protein [Ensifer adhaerens]|uniref:3'(2'),5'-bisphosphate nucleotidase CysQ family protein n=1 Tax=Ensifer adhaerens TaxID=106592 RepID=UPI000CF1A21C|nr:3'(2'),5'-bisphosphate nucleotidase CysQ [Ensifer adhaerens]